MPLGGAIVTTIGSLLAAKMASKGNRNNAGGNSQTSALEGQIAANLKDASPIGLGLLKSGRANLDLFDQFYRKLATGDRNAAMSLLAPTFGMQDRARAAALGSQLNLGRGGGSVENRVAGIDRGIADRNDQMLQLRTGAIDTVGALGGDMLSAGSGILGQASGSGLGLLGAIQSRRNSAFDQSRSIGAGIFDIFQTLGGGASNWYAGRQAKQQQYDNSFLNNALPWFGGAF